LGNSLDLNETFSALDRELSAVVPSRSIALHLAEDGNLRLVGARGRDWHSLADTGTSTIPAWVAANRNPAINLAVPGEPGSAISIPVEHRLEPGSELVAVLTLCRDPGKLFLDHEVVCLFELAPKLAAVLANAATFQKAIRLARLDPSTGESSSRALFERLDAEIARQRRGESSLAVVECAVRGPEVLGFVAQYDLGRQTLNRVAEELDRCCREYDFVARCGDEFIIVLPECGRTGLETLEERIRTVIAEISLRMGLPLTARLGAAYCPEDGLDAEDLLAAAERRLLPGVNADGRSGG
jgi:diguanylate cyclase (GGDEF)-like protein